MQVELEAHRWLTASYTRQKRVLWVRSTCRPAISRPDLNTWGQAWECLCSELEESTGFSEVREGPQVVQLHKELPCWLTSGGSGGNHTSKVMSTGVTPHLWRYCVTQLQDEESRNNTTDESPFHPLQRAQTESSWGGSTLPAFLPLPKRLGICC